MSFFSQSYCTTAAYSTIGYQSNSWASCLHVVRIFSCGEWYLHVLRFIQSGPQNTIYHCNNLVYSQPDFILFGRFLARPVYNATLNCIYLSLYAGRDDMELMIYFEPLKMFNRHIWRFDCSIFVLHMFISVVNLWMCVYVLIDWYVTRVILPLLSRRMPAVK